MSIHNSSSSVGEYDDNVVNQVKRAPLLCIKGLINKNNKKPWEEKRQNHDLLLLAAALHIHAASTQQQRSVL